MSFRHNLISLYKASCGNLTLSARPRLCRHRKRKKKKKDWTDWKENPSDRAIKDKINVQTQTPLSLVRSSARLFVASAGWDLRHVALNVVILLAALVIVGCELTQLEPVDDVHNESRIVSAKIAPVLSKPGTYWVSWVAFWARRPRYLVWEFPCGNGGQLVCNFYHADVLIELRSQQSLSN